VKHATLTKAGKKKLEQTTRLWSEAQQRFEAVFGEKRATSLRDVLQELSSEDFRTAFKATS
jgi:DNA-binding MarR family transcriptional regulator